MSVWRVFPGMTNEMAKDVGLIARVLPAIKADHLAMDRYVLNTEGGCIAGSAALTVDPQALLLSSPRCAGGPLKSPILYLGGDADPRAPVDLVKDWQLYTHEPLEVRPLIGIILT